MLVKDLLGEAANIFGVSVKELQGSKRHRYIARARFALCAALRERGASYPQIGTWLGGRDHTTIMHAVDRARFIAERDDVFAAAIERLTDFEYENKPCNDALHEA